MNKPRSITAALAGVVTLLGLQAPLAHAVSVDENVSVSGYIGSSYRHYDGDDSFDAFDIDAAKLLFETKFDPVTGVFSFYYSPSGEEDVTLLDAYFSYATEGGTTISAGKFLSWHGYEAFDIASMSQLTYATGDFLGAIPGYHAGIRVEQSGEGWVGGIAVLDSVYTPGGLYLEGDGELSDNAGFEAYFKYTGVDKLTLYAGAAYDTEGGFQPDDVVMFNFWGDYAVTDDLLVAGELIFKDAGTEGKGWAWTAYAYYNFSGSVSSAFRIAGESIDDGPDFVRATVAPTLTLSPNLLVRAELTYTDYSGYFDDSSTFFGVQSIFSF